MSVTEESYELLSPETAAAYIDERPHLAELVDTSTLDVQEIGDGNLNLVFVCQDASGRGLVLKQALPYVRLIGPEWPFTPRRAVAEARCYETHGRFAAEFLPAFYGFDAERYVLAVEDLSDHQVWRTALVEGEVHEQAADKMGRYVGRLAFHTSLLGTEAKALKLLAAEAVSPELCEITEDLVLTEPFSGAERNWFQDELADDAKRLQAPEIRRAMARAKHAFMTRGEALIHGDLHSGSVMVRGDGSTRAFDGEFCFWGPVGFDLGLQWANYTVALARDHVLEREEHGRWVASLYAQVWDAFEDELRGLWPSRVDERGFPDAFLEDWIAVVRADACAYAAAEAARRVVGLAHVGDLETLEDDAKAVASRAVISVVERLLLERFESAEAVAAAAVEEMR